MRAIVFSDSHGNFAALERVYDMHEGDADVFIFLGDGEEEIELLKMLHPEADIRYVSGNCDYMSSTPDYDVARLAGKTVFYTHGHRFGVKLSLDELEKYARNLEADVVLFGHTHEACAEYRNGVYFMNPGSVSRPREGAPSYGILDVTDAGVEAHTAKL
mgnify:CR=1 FL=1